MGLSLSLRAALAMGGCTCSLTLASLVPLRALPATLPVKRGGWCASCTVSDRRLTEMRRGHLFFFDFSQHTCMIFPRTTMIKEWKGPSSPSRRHTGTPQLS